MTGDDLDPYPGRAFIGDSIGTALASAVGGSPTTTYAEIIRVMAATRVYSTLAYYIAATVAILFGFCPKLARSSPPRRVETGSISPIRSTWCRWRQASSPTSATWPSSSPVPSRSPASPPAR
jgi:hypothetical protein